MKKEHTRVCLFVIVLVLCYVCAFNVNIIERKTVNKTINDRDLATHCEHEDMHVIKVRKKERKKLKIDWSRARKRPQQCR